MPSVQPREEQQLAVLELAESFLAMHLTWPSELFAAARGRASTEFYRSIVELTRVFLDSEVSAVNREDSRCLDG
jgi:hypothetical protein